MDEAIERKWKIAAAKRSSRTKTETQTTKETDSNKAVLNGTVAVAWFLH